MNGDDKNNDLYAKSKISFVVGLMVFFVSLFLEGYFFQVYDPSGKLAAYWSYSFMFGWTTSIEENSLNELFKPLNFQFPYAVNIVFLGCIGVAFYLAITKNLEVEEGLESLRYHAYANFFVLILGVFYLLIFPVFYLARINFYFPCILFTDLKSSITYVYSVGLGYIFQVIGFVLVFPYTIFFYKTIDGFQKTENAPEKLLDNYKKKAQEKIDFESLIAEEKEKLKVQHVNLREGSLMNKRRRIYT